jgi:hypothetical protein
MQVGKLPYFLEEAEVRSQKRLVGVRIFVTSAA